MKTIIKILVAIFIFGIIATGFTNKATTTTCILIQSTDKNISSATLSQSAAILSARLKDFSSETFDLTLIPENNQIRVIVSDKWDLKALENLLTQQGSLAFYETYNHKSLTELFKGDNHLFSLFNGSAANNSDIKIGCTSVTGVEKVNDYLNSLGALPTCRFAWSQYFDDADRCLYALRLADEKEALLSGNDVESMKCEQDKVANLNVINIRFKVSAYKIWSEATKRNLDKGIAIVLDNCVISAPVVTSIIDSGNCSITGDFTHDQASFLAAIGNNGELPVSFAVVR